MKTLLIMAGGTGGHIFPALAVARYLKNQGWRIAWLGTEQGLEARLIPKEDIPLHFISIKGLRNKGYLAWLLAPLKISLAVFQALQIMAYCKPDLVLGMGGFVSGPGAVAARLMKKPLIIHEQNALAGWTNRLLAHLATYTLAAFPNTFSERYRSQVVGNPIRADIAAIPEPSLRLQPASELRILVLGGSLGAQVFNQTVPQALVGLPVSVWHQTGAKEVQKTQKRYADLNIAARVMPFIEDMAQAYRWADIAICRAGALTVSELAAAGIASILIPYPHAVDDHQTQNAHYLVQAGAAILLPQAEFSVERLQQILQGLATNKQCIIAMAQAAYRMRKVDATEQVAHYCLEAISE